ncbi:flagellar basal-body rod protein FlgG [Desulfatitalea alkaliphila]|uniref:Flagellar basal-body rod protein FlgG n=1 Tax=Desulfatitalea alkaliphila TaxID=2929485 RepID=A0AA41ULA4_9BACT|nr:flagellar basal-body rod protein FlgG [Desulfatitalea alkaliphila]MCJ8501286.1 flagellar basal-body rod protein FlgG [Desulfatitalea alkaliphila]
MIRSLWSAASGMQAQTLNIDVIANNLSNVNTAGFKRSRAEFQDLLYETMRPPGFTTAGDSQVPTGIQVGHGTRPVATQRLFTQGDFQHTQNDLDIAIEGSGFFQIIQPNGEIAYSRAGNFKIDGEGRMVTPDGFLIEPEINFPIDTVAVSIGTGGTVSILQAGQEIPVDIGNIELARFVNPAGLSAIGRNLFVRTDASGDAILGEPGEEGYGTLAQGYLEMSNVSVVDEMVNMITAQRAYEINSKAIQAADDMLQVANNLKR